MARSAADARGVPRPRRPRSRDRLDRQPRRGDSLGGQFIWTQSTELQFPLPVSPDLGLSGRTFVDMGSLYGINKLVVNGQPVPTTDYSSVRMGVGVGVSWKTPFGLINIDLAQAVLKQKFDQTQLFRFGFGTRF